MAALLLLLSANTIACAFHEFPPFGADWYHSSFFQLLYNNKKDNKLGFISTTSNYARNFFLVPDMPGEEAHNQLLKEQIVHKTFYYQFRIFSHLLCHASVTQTNIDADAAADDGMINISSAAFNQLSLLFAYDLELVKSKKTKFILQPVIGVSTNLWSSHMFYSKIAWLKYEWSKFSPRLQAGNFTYALQAGLSAAFEHQNIRAYGSINQRTFAVNQEGYHYGKELNAFMMAGYLLSFSHKNFSVEPQAGIILEKAAYDSKEPHLNKDEDVFAGGRDIALQAGGIISIRNSIQVGGHYFFAFRNQGFTEFQLYNRARAQIFLQYSF